MPPHNPRRGAITQEDGARAAAAARDLLHLAGTTEPPIDVGALARAQGLAIVEKRLPVSGRTYVSDCVTIEVNKDHPRTTKRYTLCHEIAHTLFMDRERSRSLGLRINLGPAPSQAAEERLCEIISAELLLPGHLLRACLSAHAPGMLALDQIAAQFAISRHATLIRLEQLRDSPWPCALGRWRIAGGAHPFPRFRLAELRHIGGFAQTSLRVGLTICLDGLCRAARQDNLVSDTYSDLRLESRKVADFIWSLITGDKRS